MKKNARICKMNAINIKIIFWIYKRILKIWLRKIKIQFKIKNRNIWIKLASLNQFNQNKKVKMLNYMNK